MVVLEAMALGVPLVVTAVGGIPDVLSPREAILVPSERPHALADAIRFVSDSGVEASQRSAAALERLERQFAEGPWLQRYNDVYEIARGR